MAQTEHLPLYKAAYDLCLYFEQVVRNFSRYHKFGLGTDLRDGARKVLRLIVRANGRRDKVPVLLEIRETVEELKVLLRLGHDSQALPSFKSFEHAVGLVTDIARQNEGWLKSQREGRGRSRPAMPDGLAGPSAPRSGGPSSSDENGVTSGAGEVAALSWGQGQSTTKHTKLTKRCFARLRGFRSFVLFVSFVVRTRAYRQVDCLRRNRPDRWNCSKISPSLREGCRRRRVTRVVVPVLRVAATASGSRILV